MIKTIITDLEKLQDRADEVDCLKENQIVRETTLNLKHTMQAKNLTHLTAPQIGVNKRIMCVNFSGDIRTFVNPVLGASKGMVLSREKDASLPGKEFILPRNQEVSVMYQMPTGKVQGNTFKGRAALIIQEAVQALDGLYICDVGLPLLDGWDDLKDDEKESILRDYLDSLDMKQKDIKKEISEDPVLAKIDQNISFMEGVAKGEIELEKAE